MLSSQNDNEPRSDVGGSGGGGGDTEWLATLSEIELVRSINLTIHVPIFYIYQVFFLNLIHLILVLHRFYVSLGELSNLFGVVI